MIIPELYEISTADVYTNPKAGADTLPVVYGDLTDGTNGNWTCPLIDTVNYVYCYAGHETLSVANGNVINVYVDGVLTTGVTFNESVNYEGQGTISTLTFPSDQANKKVTVRGKGKPTVSGGATLMTNPIAIIEDILTTVGFDSTKYDTTERETARNNADSQSYTAAGIITKNIKTWTLIQNILNSFNPPKSQAFITGDGLLVLRIDTGSLGLDTGMTILPNAETDFIQGEQRLDDILNSITGTYQYNYVDNKFTQLSSEHTDGISQNLYGTRKPDTPIEFLWTRDSGTVNTVLDLILNEHKTPLWFVKFNNLTMKRLGLDIEDVVVTSFKSLYNENGEQMINQYWKIKSITPIPNGSGLELQVLDTGSFLTAIDLYDGTYLYDGTITYGNTRDMTDY